ncbi:hypothetical protein [Salinirubrum litoreum]|uniref:SipW-cognate class signal peptide n=1 Tax=Salinirubrum litoreum TaxID=1126234 RepID=A0ABD5R5I2_9EURY|nr:hypothetical protein [Salinirubrum litoreum]
MSADGRDRSIQKLTVLAAVGMVLLALGITGGNATYAYLADGETLGTANDPNVIATGNIASEPVTPGAGNTAPTTNAGNSSGSDRTCAGNTGAGDAGTDCTTASMLTVFGVPAIAAVRREYSLPASRRGS